MLPETVDGLSDFADCEGALFQLPPLGEFEDLREAVDFRLGVRVQCVLGGRLVSEEAVLGGLEHCGWVVGEGAVLLSDRGDGAVAGVGHGVVEVADGLVAEFMLSIPLVFLGDALLPVDVPLLQVWPAVGYLRPAVIWRRLSGVSVWRRIASCCFACQRSWSMSPRAVGGRSSSVWGCCWKPQATASVRMAVSRSVGSGWMRPARSLAL